jgi:hypothetical protein
LTLFCPLVLAEDKGEWKEYSSTEGRFKLLFPEDPEVGKVPTKNRQCIGQHSKGNL